MVKLVVKFLASVVTALCIVVALFCPWGFLSAFEPGQETYRILFPVIFAGAILLGTLSYQVAKRQ
jgi:hypothetical protein